MTGCIAKTQQGKTAFFTLQCAVAKSTRKKKAPAVATSDGKRSLGSMPNIPVAAVFSFLKDKRGALSWTLRDLTQTLNIREQEARRVLTILKLQGYVSETSDNELLTTASGEIVSGSKPPRFTHERVDEAVSELFDRIAANNSDRNADFKITQAVAFGDFLSEGANCQAADVGIELTPREPASGRDQLNYFLKQLRGKGQFLNIKPFEPWMSKRSHRRLL
jgi:hypothetical protein